MASSSSSGSNRSKEEKFRKFKIEYLKRGREVLWHERLKLSDGTKRSRLREGGNHVVTGGSRKRPCVVVDSRNGYLLEKVEWVSTERQTREENCAEWTSTTPDSKMNWALSSVGNVVNFVYNQHISNAVQSIIPFVNRRWRRDFSSFARIF